MPKLPVISGKKLVKVLSKIGFYVVKQEGSHIKMVRFSPLGKQTVIIPNHKEIKKGTLRNGILGPINLSTEEFIKLLRK